MTYIMVDVEADGPCPGLYSMIEIGAVNCSDPNQTFYGRLKPISDKFVPEALAVTGYSREHTLSFSEPSEVIEAFSSWLYWAKKSSKRLIFISDNNGFDWQFVNYYFHLYLERNPFGHSSRNLNDLFKGLQGTVFTSFKFLRDTKHTHNPVDDAMGNVEALLKMRDKYGLKL